MIHTSKNRVKTMSTKLHGTKSVNPTGIHHTNNTDTNRVVTSN